MLNATPNAKPPTEGMSATPAMRSATKSPQRRRRSDATDSEKAPPDARHSSKHRSKEHSKVQSKGHAEQPTKGDTQSKKRSESPKHHSRHHEQHRSNANKREHSKSPSMEPLSPADLTTRDGGTGEGDQHHDGGHGSPPSSPPLPSHQHHMLEKMLSSATVSSLLKLHDDEAQSLSFSAELVRDHFTGLPVQRNGVTPIPFVAFPITDYHEPVSADVVTAMAHCLVYASPQIRFAPIARQFFKALHDQQIEYQRQLEMDPHDSIPNPNNPARPPGAGSPLSATAAAAAPSCSDAPSVPNGARNMSPHANPTKSPRPDGVLDAAAPVLGSSSGAGVASLVPAVSGAALPLLAMNGVENDVDEVRRRLTSANGMLHLFGPARKLDDADTSVRPTPPAPTNAHTTAATSKTAGINVNDTASVGNDPSTTQGQGNANNADAEPVIGNSRPPIANKELLSRLSQPEDGLVLTADGSNGDAVVNGRRSAASVTSGVVAMECFQRCQMVGAEVGFGSALTHPAIVSLLAEGKTTTTATSSPGTQQMHHPHFQSVGAAFGGATSGLIGSAGASMQGHHIHTDDKMSLGNASVSSAQLRTPVTAGVTPRSAISQFTKTSKTDETSATTTALKNKTQTDAFGSEESRSAQLMGGGVAGGVLSGVLGDGAGLVPTLAPVTAAALKRNVDRSSTSNAGGPAATTAEDAPAGAEGGDDGASDGSNANTSGSHQHAHDNGTSADHTVKGSVTKAGSSQPSMKQTPTTRPIDQTGAHGGSDPTGGLMAPTPIPDDDSDNRPVARGQKSDGSSKKTTAGNAIASTSDIAGGADQVPPAPIPAEMTLCVSLIASATNENPTEVHRSLQEQSNRRSFPSTQHEVRAFTQFLSAISTCDALVSLADRGSGALCHEVSRLTGLPYTLANWYPDGMPGELRVGKIAGFNADGEVWINGLKRGQRVAILLDVLKSGETTAGLVQACTRAGCPVVVCAFVAELVEPHRGREHPDLIGLPIVSVVKVALTGERTKLRNDPADVASESVLRSSTAAAALAATSQPASPVAGPRHPPHRFPGGGAGSPTLGAQTLPAALQLNTIGAGGGTPNLAVNAMMGSVNTGGQSGQVSPVHGRGMSPLSSSRQGLGGSRGLGASGLSDGRSSAPPSPMAANGVGGVGGEKKKKKSVAISKAAMLTLAAEKEAREKSDAYDKPPQSVGSLLLYATSCSIARRLQLQSAAPNPTIHGVGTTVQSALISGQVNHQHRSSKKDVDDGDTAVSNPLQTGDPAMPNESNGDDAAGGGGRPDTLKIGDTDDDTESNSGVAAAPPRNGTDNENNDSGRNGSNALQVPGTGAAVADGRSKDGGVSSMNDRSFLTNADEMGSPRPMDFSPTASLGVTRSVMPRDDMNALMSPSRSPQGADRELSLVPLPDHHHSNVNDASPMSQRSSPTSQNPKSSQAQSESQKLAESGDHPDASGGDQTASKESAIGGTQERGRSPDGTLIPAPPSKGPRGGAAASRNPRRSSLSAENATDAGPTAQDAVITADKIADRAGDSGKGASDSSKKTKSQTEPAVAARPTCLANLSSIAEIRRLRSQCSAAASANAASSIEKRMMRERMHRDSEEDLKTSLRTPSSRRGVPGATPASRPISRSIRSTALGNGGAGGAAPGEEKDITELVKASGSGEEDEDRQVMSLETAEVEPASKQLYTTKSKGPVARMSTAHRLLKQLPQDLIERKIEELAEDFANIDVMTNPDLAYPYCFFRLTDFGPKMFPGFVEDLADVCVALGTFQKCDVILSEGDRGGAPLAIACARRTGLPFVLANWYPDQSAENKGTSAATNVQIGYSGVGSIVVNGIKPGDRCIFVDDMLSSGGTAEGVLKSATKLGGIAVEAIFVSEKLYPNAKEKQWQAKVEAVKARKDREQEQDATQSSSPVSVRPTPRGENGTASATTKESASVGGEVTTMPNFLPERKGRGRLLSKFPTLRITTLVQFTVGHDRTAIPPQRIGDDSVPPELEP